MEDFHQQFLLDSIAALENISQNLQNKSEISDSSRREIFRTLHTIKGTAQTFGFSTSSRLAHLLEDLLAAGENPQNLFSEGIDFLIKSLKHKDFEIPTSFLAQINLAAQYDSPEKIDSDYFSHFVPQQFTAQLSIQEKAFLNSALQNGKNLFCFEIGFDLMTFADELINLREILNAAGDIIATLPSEKFSGNGKIGFQILFASRLQIAEIEQIAETNKAEIIFKHSPEVFSNDAAGVLAQIIKHGRETAGKMGKQIDFAVSGDETEISADKLKIVFDALLHLTRNAVDHGVEKAGKIEISLREIENGWRLTISDDGRGIDIEKIKSKAIEKNLTTIEANLTEQETADLIFLPEFSTKSEVTEISGRGIGLDAVKFAIEKAGGTIAVKSQSGQGTTFEIFLPR